MDAASPTRPFGRVGGGERRRTPKRENNTARQKDCCGMDAADHGDSFGDDSACVGGFVREEIMLAQPVEEVFCDRIMPLGIDDDNGEGLELCPSDVVFRNLGELEVLP